MIVVNLDVMMAKRKMSLSQLSEKVDITLANLSILKNNKAKAVRFSTLEAICAALDCQPGDILEYVPDECRITTIENYEKRIPIARENFRRAGKEEQITLLEGDAAEVLKRLDGPYDFVFMDAAKGQYIHYLPDILRLLPPGGCLVSDNVMQDGDVIESRFAVERRNRTIHARMREYLYELKHNDELTTSIIPLGDGVAVSIKN